MTCMYNTHIKALCTVDGVYDMQVIIIINEVMKDIMTTHMQTINYI